MEVSALKYSGGVGLHGRSPLLRLQSDERLVALTRRGNAAAFEVLVSRYESRLLAFCRHMLGSREDAEDVLQEVLAAAFNAMTADERPINVRPWLYRIARNRSLNHLRRSQPVGVDSMDIHFSDNGASTADKVHDREEFRLLVGDINGLAETQKTALVLREMDALSYEQIAEAMETTVPSVKSLLVRARVSLAEAAEARVLTCDDVRLELGEVAEGLLRKPSPLVRRHLRTCERCVTFNEQLKETSKALAAVLPLGPLVLLKKFLITHVGHSAGSGAGAAGAGGTAAGSTILGGSTAGGVVSAGIGAIATKAAAGLAAAALVTAGAVEVTHSVSSTPHRHATYSSLGGAVVTPLRHSHHDAAATTDSHKSSKNGTAGARGKKGKAAANAHKPATNPNGTAQLASALKPRAKTQTGTGTKTASTAHHSQPGRRQVQTDPTVLAPATTVPSDAITPSPGSAGKHHRKH